MEILAAVRREDMMLCSWEFKFQKGTFVSPSLMISEVSDGGLSVLRQWARSFLLQDRRLRRRKHTLIENSGRKGTHMVARVHG